MKLALFKKWRSAATTGTPSSTGQHDRLAVLTAKDLLSPYAGELAALKARASVPASHWKTLYLVVLENYAGLVQRLPASESHHHAGYGGLLQHGIEVAQHALDLKQGILLPRGGAPEVQSRVQDLWTYACFTAALLHDLGKPVTDQRITLHDGHYKKPWMIVQGAMPPGATYSIEFNPARQYRQHERVPPLIAHHLIPVVGLQWLAGDQEVLHNWLAAIQGDMADADAIGEIVGKADGLSVARNLSGSKNIQLPTAKVKPLVERLMTGLRYLLDQGELPLNRRGAAAYLDGDTLWLVSKTTLDKLRTHLIEEGQPGIPSRNDRLMDELQQHNLLVPNGDRAIWNSSITIGDWQKELTCLRMEAGRIWSDPARRPEPMDGHVEAAGTTGDIAADEKNATAEHAATTKVKRAPATAQDARNDSGQSIDGLPLPFDVPAPPVDDGAPATADQASEPQQSLDAATATPPAAKNAHLTSQSSNGQVAELDPSEDAGKRFLTWLKQSIENETVPINTPKARIHVLPEGLALVSPRIFRDFDSANWSHVQKRFQKLGLHRKTPTDENIWTCQVVGTRRQAILKVIVIPNAASIIDIKLPVPNTALKLVDCQ